MNHVEVVGQSHTITHEMADIQWQAFIHLKELGASVRQLQRLTGIDRGIIQRAR